jgi:hypothetical protein
MANRCGRRSRGWRSSSRGRRPPSRDVRLRVRARHHGGAARRRWHRRLDEDVSVFRKDGTALHETRRFAAARGRVDASELLRPPRRARALAGASGVGRSATLSQTGRSSPRRRPRCARPALAARCAPADAPAGAVRQLARPRQEPFDRTSPAPRCSLQARRGGRPGAGARRGGRATGAVDTIDLKGQYGFEVKDPEALAALYDQVLAAFPDAYLEDPHDLPEIKQRLGDHLDRVSQDAPIRDVENIGTTPLAPRIVNVKPSRIGSLRRLFGVYARCARERRPTYWRWHGRAGRGPRADRAACRFVPRRCANDVAPSAYNETTRRAACRPARWRRAPGLLALLGGIGAHTARAAHTVRMCDRGGR